MYILIKGDEDGNPNTFLSEPIGEFLASSLDSYGVSSFEDAKFLRENPDPNYWDEGVAVLVKAEVVVPKSVTSQWKYHVNALQYDIVKRFLAMGNSPRKIAKGFGIDASVVHHVNETATYDQFKQDNVDDIFEKMFGGHL
jgi:hypothetical protein